MGGSQGLRKGIHALAQIHGIREWTIIQKSALSLVQDNSCMHARSSAMWPTKATRRQVPVSRASLLIQWNN